ncbi:hypothetical protein [Aquimarina algicola]|uniref:PorT family protein n=1 Tax=Aquimarina algicola TaxID=2589995 RepID=A0A504J9G4_9FLAO|nr:hypothetical protein [Aquimarina algicola]TPN85235.1 hypothetical protein FHK87_14500 [Aquimarina algicola]
MKSFLSSLLGIFSIFTISAQSIYETGYFIDNDGNRKECLIKKLSWKDNPTEFEWKKNISSTPKKENIEDIKEFAVGKEYLYKRYILEIDLKGDNLGRATKLEKPDLKLQKLFLRVILESKTSLYQYSKNGVNRFFYTDKDAVYPELLVYKVFYTPDETKDPGKKIIAHKNTEYRNQLIQILNCGKDDLSEIEYTQKDLKKYFKRYNVCKGNYMEYTIRKKVNQTHVGIVGGINHIDFSHSSPIEGNTDEITYQKTYAPRYGIYIETFIPFSKVDLSFFLETTYNAFSIKSEDTSTLENELELDYKGINIAFAPRFHIYLSSKFELFLEGGIAIDYDLDTKSLPEPTIDEIKETSTDFFYGGGLGYGRFKVGYRKYTGKDISDSNIVLESDLKSSSLYLAVDLF